MPALKNGLLELLLRNALCINYTIFSESLKKKTICWLWPLPFHPFLQTFTCTILKNFLSLFWTRYVDDTFTLIDTSLQNVDHILQTMNSIDINIQFTYEIENIGVLPFLGTLFSCTDEGFSTSVYRKIFTVSLPPHSRSCHPTSQKMATFYTFVDRAFNICSDPISFNSKIQYLKAIALDRDYNPSIVDKTLFKLQNP